MTNPLALSRPAEILLVEDNDDDVELMRIGFKRSRLLVNLHRVRNGEDCMDFLRKVGPHAAAPTPDIILLDLNMPKMDGREVLADIVADPTLRHLPIVVLTTSSADLDVLAAYKLRCNSYIVKPIDFKQFATVIQALGNYWFTVVVLPSSQSVLTLPSPQ